MLNRSVPIFNLSLVQFIFLLFGSFLAALVSGAAGFGGALLLLPVLSWTIGPTAAIPLLTLAQLIGNLARVAVGFKQISWKPVFLFIATAIPFSILGAFSFVTLPKELIMRIIGLCLVVFATFKFLKLINLQPGRATLLTGGGITGLLSGLIGSAGPLGAAIFLSLNLSPVGYIASEAVTATVMHLVKTAVYQRYLDVDLSVAAIAAAMGVFMILGTLTGKKIIEKMTGEKFTIYITVLLGLLGITMIITG